MLKEDEKKNMCIYIFRILTGLYFNLIGSRLK